VPFEVDAMVQYDTVRLWDLLWLSRQSVPLEREQAERTGTRADVITSVLPEVRHDTSNK